MSTHKMDNDEKRTIFMAVGIVTIIVTFFTALAALEDKSWSPLIILVEIGGLLLGTLVFFYFVIRALWVVAKRLFPDDK